MDMTCEPFRTELSAFLDGQMDSNDLVGLQGHLDGCIGCREELETLKKLTKFLNEELKSDEFEIPDLWPGVEAAMPTVCEVMQEELSAYLDGELTPAAQEGVNQHLKSCSICLASFKSLNAANLMLSKGLELPATLNVDLWPAVRAQINEDCALIRSELSSYADQEVATLRHRNITNHLIDCQECRLDFNGLSTVGDLIRESYKPDMAADFDLWPGIKAKMQVVPFAPKAAAAAAPNKVQNSRPRWLVATVAAAVIGLAGVAISVTIPKVQGQTISSETYLIESALLEPSDTAEAAVYEQ